MKESTKDYWKKIWSLYPMVIGIGCTFVIWLLIFFDIILSGDGEATINFINYNEREVEFALLSLGLVGFVHRFYVELESKLYTFYIVLILLVLILIVYLV